MTQDNSLFLYQDINLFQKILKGKKNVLEIGCSDGFNSRIVKQEVKNLDLCDTEEELINNAKKF